MAVTFYFARHGETQFNVQNRVQGWCDSPLTSSGIYDAYRLGRSLADVEFVGACTSDAGRAQHTLSLVLESRENERMYRAEGHGLGVDPVRADEIADLVGADEAADMFEGEGYAVGEGQAQALAEFLRARGCLNPASLVPDGGGVPAADSRWLMAAESWKPSVSELEWVDYPSYALSALAEAPRLAHPVPVRCDARLREWCFGDLEGDVARRLRNRMFDLFGDDIPREEQNERLNEIADHIARTDETGRAENFDTIARRLESFIRDCARSVEMRGGGNVLVVSHALLIRTLVFLYARERVSEPPKIKNGSLTVVTWDKGKVTVEAVGDTSHLERLGA